MTSIRRELMFRVMDDQQEMLPYLHFLDRFHKCDSMLRWLIANGLTGKAFLKWSKENFQFSMLEMARFVIKQIEGVSKKETRPVWIGKDARY